VAVSAAPVQHHASCGPLVRYWRGGAVSADVTGDGVADRAFLVRSRCGWSVELVSRGRVFRVTIVLPYYSKTPTVRRAGNLDGRPGKELLVTTDESDVVTYRVVTFAKGLRLMSLKTASASGFTEGAGSAYGQGFGCLRPGLIEQISWGRSPPTVGERQLFAARGLSWQLVKTTKFVIRTGVMPVNVRHPFTRCR
jgi:hypothetical protein